MGKEGYLRARWWQSRPCITRTSKDLLQCHQGKKKMRKPRDPVKQVQMETKAVGGTELVSGSREQCLVRASTEVLRNSRP